MGALVLTSGLSGSVPQLIRILLGQNDAILCRREVSCDTHQPANSFSSTMTNMAMSADSIDDATSGNSGAGLLRDDNEDIEGLPSLSPNSALPLPTSSRIRMTTITETQPPIVRDSDEAETIDEEDLQLPPLSSYVDGWRFWWRFAQVPILFIMVNAIVMVTVENKENRFGGPGVSHAYTTTTISSSSSSSSSLYPQGGPSNDTVELIDPDFAKMRYKSIVLGILFLVDSAVLFRVALSMEKSVQALRRRESNVDAAENSYSLTHAHARVSKMLDNFLSQGRSKLPEVSVFVNVLYLGTGFCFVATAVSLALYLFLHTSKADTVCNSYHQAPAADLAIKDVPDALQKWASLNGEMHMFDSSGKYAHMVNGYTYFVASNQTQINLNPNEDMYYGYGTEVLFSAGPDGFLKSYPSISVPREITNLAGPSEDASEGFCCLYRNKTAKIQHRGGWSDQEQKLLCIFGRDDKSSPTLSAKRKGSDSSKELLPKEMKTASLPFQENDDGARGSVLQKSLSDVNLRAYDGLLYLRVKWYIYDTRGRPGGNTEQVDIYSVKPQTSVLNWTSVGTSHASHMNYYQYSYSRGDRHRSPCFDRIKTVATVVGVPLLFLTAYGLLIWRDIPAGMASFCIGVLAMLSYVNEELAVGVGALASVVGATTLSLFGTPTKILPPWISRDMILWGIYATMAVLALASPNFWCCWKWPIGRLCLAAATGFVLDHPVLHIMGWTGAAMTLYFLFLAIWGSTMTTTTSRNFNDDYYYHDGGQNNDKSLWPTVPLGLVITCGLFSLSFSLQKSRPYLVAYSRRFWRIVQMASRNASSSSRGGQGAQPNNTRNNNNNNNNDTVMMQSLLTTRDE
jgi:hypothetical protein